MATISQADRAVTVSSPLGKDVLGLRRMTAIEAISEPFEFRLELYSLDMNIELNKILGHSMTVTLERDGSPKRYFNGEVDEFCFAGIVGDYALYQATLRPGLWSLKYQSGFEVYVDKKVDDIIKSVLGQRDVEFDIRSAPDKREHCAQYGETDFDFVSRLMEEEGLHYYHTHSDGKHKLHATDQEPKQHPKIAGSGTIPYFPPETADQRGREHISDWTMSGVVRPNAYAVSDFNLKKGESREGKANAEGEAKGPKGRREIVEFLRRDDETKDHGKLAKRRVEEVAADREQMQGAGNAAGITIGHTFELSDHPREDQNGEYLIIAATHQLVSNAQVTADDTSDPEPYSCRFTAIGTRAKFRPARRTPPPVMQGVQTATVEDISDPEAQGRIKVNFHWDKETHTISNWIPVVQNWAGDGWGGLALPPVAQVVIVEFLGGDPERPIVTGRLYNDKLKPPYDVTEDPTLMTITTPTGNELRLDGEVANDRMGSGESKGMVFLHAEKSLFSNVEKDEERNVKGERKVEIDKDDTLKVGKTLTLEAGDKITLKAGQASIELLKNGKITIEGMDVKIKGAAKAALEGANVTVKGDAMTTVKGGLVKIN